MDEERLDLGLVDEIEATDVGEPGQRTFKITAASGRGRAVVWMEKEQLFQIGLAIRQFMTIEAAPASKSEFQPEFPAPAVPGEVEFKASELRIRHDARSDVFTVEAFDPETEDDNEEPMASVQFSFPREVGEKLSAEALEAVSRGRPRCELCGGPVDSDGHVCPRSNGHHKGDFELA